VVQAPRGGPGAPCSVPPWLPCRRRRRGELYDAAAAGPVSRKRNGSELVGLGHAVAVMINRWAGPITHRMDCGRQISGPIKVFFFEKKRGYKALDKGLQPLLKRDL
jgi:hypothetical protein